MTISRLMTAEELGALPRGKERYELMKGELITMPPAGEEHGEIAGNAYFLVSAFVRERGLGRTYVAETGFMLEHDPDTVRAPDFAFVPVNRIPSGKRSVKFSELVPALVVEVLSPGDAAVEVEEKIEQWLAFGVDEVWVVNPKRRTLTVHAKGRDAHTFRDGERVMGTGSLAGFSMKVGALFPG